MFSPSDPFGRIGLVGSGPPFFPPLPQVPFYIMHSLFVTVIFTLPVVRRTPSVTRRQGGWGFAGGFIH